MSTYRVSEGRRKIFCCIDAPAFKLIWTDVLLLSRGSASVLLTFQASLLLKFALENLIARYLRQYGRHGPEITFHALTLRMKLIGIV